MSALHVKVWRARHPLAVALALLCPAGARAAIDPDPSPAPLGPQAVFNNAFLRTAESEPADLSRFERGNVTLAGSYRPSIVVNGRPQPGTREVAFRSVADSESAQPCFDRAMLIQFGLDTDKLTARADGDPSLTPLDAKPFCGHLERYIPGATVDFDEAEQELNVTIPQAFVHGRARGYVSPDLWDEGGATALLDYSANTFQVRRNGERSTSSYLGVRTGANIGGWRIRHAGAMTLQDGASRWRNTLTYAQHDLTSARAQLTLGEAYTGGEIFDTVRVRGAGIVSDPRMLPASQRGYAPVIRGVAESNAQVAIRQNGYLIHSVNVAPGAFEIDDVFPTGYGSDLEVTITEADGRTKRIVVPYTSVPQMLREGSTRFAIWAGQVAETSVRETPFLFQGTVQHGVTTNTTVYLGTTASNSYWSGLVGAAVNTPIGAFSLDVTGSRAALRGDGIRRGASTRLRYTRALTSTGTNLGIAAQRFSTRDFLDVRDAARLRSQLRRGLSPDGIGGERSRFDATVSQAIGDGQLSLTGSIADYWKGKRRSVDYTVAYGNSWRSVNYNISVQRSRLGDVFGSASSRTGGDTDTTVYLSLSIPLGSATSAPNLSLSHNRAEGGSSTQATLNGSLDNDRDLSYTVAAGRSDVSSGRSSSTGNVSARYRTFAGTYQAGAGRNSGGSTQFSLSASGAVVAHRHGVTFSQELGETNAIVHAPGAAGARVESHAGVRLDRYGNAVVRSLLPYQLNTIAVDPRGASHDVELQSTSESVAPRAGAFPVLEYRTSVAQSLLIQATRPDGQPLPFGASVYDDEGQAVGVVGQGSKIFARGELAGRQLTVSWSDDEGGSCRIEVPATLENIEEKGMHRALRAPCTTGGAALKKAA